MNFLVSSAKNDDFGDFVGVKLGTVGDFEGKYRDCCWDLIDVFIAMVMAVRRVKNFMHDLYLSTLVR